MKKKSVFISWMAFNRRSQLISEKFQIKPYFIHSLKHLYILAPLRYILHTIKTLKILIREKPEIIFVQNPPILAPLVAYFYSKIRNSKFVIDSHTGALLAPWWKWSLPLHAFLSRRALTTIVTNKYLNDIVKAWNAETFILADIPTHFSQGSAFPLKGKFNLAVINTFSPDEPIEIILEAAALLPDVEFYITGDTVQAKKKYFMKSPVNVTFTDYLSDEKYLGLLREVHAIMVLTTDDHTMQRGACEAVSLGKPLIISNWPLLVKYFNKGTIYVDNNKDSIREGIIKMKRIWKSLEKDVLELQADRKVEWERKYYLLKELLSIN
jgi:glycosyltransferase involved in cell wall biosynthesis